MSTDADITLERLWDEGTSALQDEDARPGTTYEVAPDIVGTMPWPTLADRESFTETGGEMQSLFREDATADDFALFNLQSQGVDFSDPPADESEVPEGVDTPVEEIQRLAEEAEHPARGDVSVEDFTQTTAKVNCERVAALLEFEQEVEPNDIVPEMAAVVVAHFTSLGPDSNGQPSD